MRFIGSILRLGLIALAPWLARGGEGRVTTPSRPASPATVPPAPPQPIPPWGLMRQTRAQMKVLMNALENYRSANNTYPPADTLDQLLPLLVPAYLPADYQPVDAWQRPFRYAALWRVPGRVVGRYRLASAGADGAWQFDSPWLYAASWMEQPAEDLVFDTGGQLTRFSDPDEPVHDAYFEAARFLRAWAQGIEQYNTDYNRYPPGDSFEEATSRFAAVYADGLLYTGFPSLDPWRHLYRYESWSSRGDPLLPDHYCIGSAAFDRQWERASLRDYAWRDFPSYTDDLVLCDGAWVQLADDPELTPPQRYLASQGTIKTIASALESYRVDFNGYPPDTTLDALLARLISGGYLGGSPGGWRLDGWRVPLRYQPFNCAPAGCMRYRLASAAADSAWEFPDLAPYAPGNNSTLAQDIVLENGAWLRVCPTPALCPVAAPPALKSGR